MTKNSTVTAPMYASLYPAANSGQLMDVMRGGTHPVLTIIPKHKLKKFKLNKASIQSNIVTHIENCQWQQGG